jgi:hypothetical protein
MSRCGAATAVWTLLLSWPIFSSETGFDQHRLYFEGHECSVLDAKSLSAFENAVNKARNYQTYCKISLAVKLIECLKDETPTHLVGHEHADNEHDLNIKAGCAARALEELLGFDLQKIHVPNSYGERLSKQLIPIAEEATRQLKAYRAGVVECLSKRELSIDDLKKKYEKKITKQNVDPKDWAKEGLQSIEQLDALFAEWCPIGKKLTDVEAIVGASTMQYEGLPAFSFRCYHPDGAGVKFMIKDGVITGVFWAFGRD